MRFVSPGGIPVDYTTPSPLAAVIDRPTFDRALAARAVAVGADVRTNARVAALECSASGVYAIVGGEAIQARLAVLACGATYAFQRRFDLGLPRTHLHTAQRELPAARLGGVELHFGQGVAPGGFAWAVPVERPDGGYVRVGAMARLVPDVPLVHGQHDALARMAAFCLAASRVRAPKPPRQRLAAWPGTGRA